MLSKQTVARVSATLDEAKELLEGDHKGYGINQGVIRAHAKVTEAQRLLLGDEPTDPKVN